MAGDLLIPRCEVFWGDINLTSYEKAKEWPGSKGPQPLVYDVKVSLQESGQTPKGSMKWLPSGVAFKAYEEILEANFDKTIVVRFFYTTGLSIAFEFVWAGQSENHGIDMSIEVKLASEIDGLIMSNLRSVAQSDDQGISMKSAIEQLEKLYGVDGFNLIRYYGEVSKELEKVKVKSNYAEGTTFASALENIAEQNGNLVFINNIKNDESPGSSLVLFPPYTWEGSTYSGGEVKPNPSAPVSVKILSGPASGGSQSTIDPTTRYGYFIGPGIINSMTKTSEWTPPQSTKTYTLNTQAKVQPRNPSSAGQPSPTRQQQTARDSQQQAASSSGASGTANSRARPGMRLIANEEGEKKKLLIQQERTASLSASVFMCPALTGVKPCDILFVPNYAGTYIEDWIVTSVEYEQTNGGVVLNIQAARQFGMGNAMHESNAKFAQDSVKGTLTGEGATIENWVKYAWGGV